MESSFKIRTVQLRICHCYFFESFFDYEKAGQMNTRNKSCIMIFDSNNGQDLRPAQGVTRVLDWKGTNPGVVRDAAVRRNSVGQIYI